MLPSSQGKGGGAARWALTPAHEPFVGYISVTLVWSVVFKKRSKKPSPAHVWVTQECFAALPLRRGPQRHCALCAETHLFHFGGSGGSDRGQPPPGRVGFGLRCGIPLWLAAGSCQSQTSSSLSMTHSQTSTFSRFDETLQEPLCGNEAVQLLAEDGRK